MKLKILILAQLAAIVVLALLWLRQKKETVSVLQSSEASLTVLSNDLSKTSAKLTEQEKVNAALETNLVKKVQEIESKSAENSQLAVQSQQISNQLASLSLTLSQTKESLELTQHEVARRNARIAELESQNSSLDKQAEQLKSAIGDLEGKIKETETKLAGAEGEKSFLLKELQRLRAEKAELERQFNDLAVLKEQVRKLKDELAIAQRLDWIRRGLYGHQMKAGERMVNAFRKPATPSTNRADLNVEIRSPNAKSAPVPAPANPPAVVPPTAPAPRP
ncbi:MAG: hypothetical protein FJ404_06430 [Verrucomicrobia bacterium]|nr:hypothetical protein [Verrucomicrobiota bacterium]